MFVQAIYLKFCEGVTVEVAYIDGSIVRFDLSTMFSKYPQLKALEDRKLFESGHLDVGGYGIIWNDELDFDATSIYESGEVIGRYEVDIKRRIGFLLEKAREEVNLTQAELSKTSRIDQGDISRIERGIGNPTLEKIDKLFKAMGKRLSLALL